MQDNAITLYDWSIHLGQGNLYLFGRCDGKLHMIEWAQVESYDVGFYYDNVEDPNVAVVETADHTYILGDMHPNFEKLANVTYELLTLVGG